MNFWDSWGTTGFSRKTLPHGVTLIEVLDISPFSNKQFCLGTAEKEQRTSELSYIY
jgi:hypothetical protein